MERIDFKMNEEDKKDIVKRDYEFSLRILYLVQELPNNPLSNKIISQNSKLTNEV
jgi:hypothetical protein